jgi:hypothetical protein
MGPTVPERVGRGKFLLPFPGKERRVAVVESSSAIPDVLAEVGPRLKRLRPDGA